MIIRNHPKKNTYQIVLLDHGLYTTSRPEFTVEYAKFWKALFTLDVSTLTSIADHWGISDTQSFASATLQRPWKLNSTPLHLELPTYSINDIYELQLGAKEKVRDFLKNTDLLPQELIFIGRNLNLIRSNNKAMGSPVNRINIMAHYASMVLVKPPSNLSHLSYFMRFSTYFFSYYDYTIFQTSLFLSALTFYGNRYSQRTYEILTGKKAKGHEDLLDQIAILSMRKMGLQVDEDSFNA